MSVHAVHWIAGGIGTAAALDVVGAAGALLDADEAGASATVPPMTIATLVALAKIFRLLTNFLSAPASGDESAFLGPLCGESLLLSATGSTPVRSL
jgi:hypothetical protein